MIPIALHRYIIVFIISFNLFKLFVSCVNAYKQREPTDLNNEKMSRSTWKPFCDSAYLLEATIKKVAISNIYNCFILRALCRYNVF